MRFFRLHGATISLGIFLALMFATPLLQQRALGQATTFAGVIQGTIADPSGALVVGAKVTIRNPDRGFEKVLITSSVGFYSSGALQPGNYTLRVEATGFSTATRQIVVQVGESANGDAKLSLQGTVSEVSVAGTSVQVDTSGSTVEGVLNRQEIATLPLNGKNFLDLAQLQPGVQIQDGTSFDPTKNGYSSISFGGRYGRTARITLDGVDISDENVGTTTQNVSEDAIQEFQIAQSSLDISTSLTSSGSVNVVTRSGTNKFHGDGTYNFRDKRAGNAEPVGYTEIPGVDSNYFQRNNMGGALGGPIKTDKLFFFGQYEYFRQNIFNPVIFSGPFAGLISVDGGGYPAKFHETMTMGHVDWNGPKGIRVFGRWNYNNNSDTVTAEYSPFVNRDNTPDYAGGVDFSNGNFTHSFHVGYFKFANHIGDATAGLYNPTPGLNLEIAPFGFSTGPNDNAPQATVQSNKQFKYDGSWVKGKHILRYGAGVNHMLGGGYASFFGYGPQDYTIAGCDILRTAEAGSFAAIGSTSVQTADDGCSTSEGGVAAAYGAATNPLNYPIAGGYYYVLQGNGEGYDTEIPQFGFPGGGQEDWRFSAYLSDTFKWTRRLTVNVGLRYVRDTGRTDSDLAAIPQLDNQFTQAPNLGNTVKQPNANFGPQVGFAYDFKGNGKTVVRGGVGLYYENNVWNNVLFDRPPKLSKGLFWSIGTDPTYNGVPVGEQVIQGTSTPCTSGPSCAPAYTFLAVDQAAFQQATKAAGAASNAAYVLNTLAEGPNVNGDELFAPGYRTPTSYQMNIGVQHEIRPGIVLSADYVRSIGLHTLIGQDVNHVGDAKYLNTTNAQAAIAATLSACGSTYYPLTIDQAINNCPGLHGSGGATIFDFAANGLDSGNSYSYGYSGTAAFNGQNTSWGQMYVLYPSGRSVYNGLDLSLQGQIRRSTKGLSDVNTQTSYSYSHYDATGTSELGDADFGGTAWDNNHPTKYFGPNSLDRHNQLSIGISAKTFGGVEFDTIAHLLSSMPANMNLPTNASSNADIFTDDANGSGVYGVLVPGTNVGSFGRQYNGNNINRLITQYNSTYAGKLSPAGQALVSAGLFTSTELSELGGVLTTLAKAPTNQVSNDILRVFDVNLGRTIKIRGERFTVRPSVGAFNILNATNYNSRTGTLNPSMIAGQLTGTTGSPNGTAGHLAESNDRVGLGSGVYAEGSPRQLEYTLKITF
jgi:hypothetical protein